MRGRAKRGDPNGSIVVAVLCCTWVLNVLFGILIARATYRAMIRKDPMEYMRLVLLNDSLDRIRNAVVGEVASWAAI
jgi:hypothetical protein